MRLADFIRRDMSSILREWEAFAATLVPAARHMDAPALRDHAQQILNAVIKDLSTPQTRHAQRQKSLGRSPRLPDAPETAAQTHALLRARHGFNINQMVSEYRALRASVLRLWIDDGHPGPSDFDDMVRFNEAIDQAVTESVGISMRRSSRRATCCSACWGTTCAARCRPSRPPLNTWPR
ncbi:protein of unknown function [Cupriavidus taiwanensis]|nr:protein of unknown function [Cupriavidus taiwanensis]